MPHFPSTDWNCTRSRNLCNNDIFWQKHLCSTFAGLHWINCHFVRACLYQIWKPVLWYTCFASMFLCSSWSSQPQIFRNDVMFSNAQPATSGSCLRRSVPLRLTLASKLSGCQVERLGQTFQLPFPWLGRINHRPPPKKPRENPFEYSRQLR